VGNPPLARRAWAACRLLLAALQAAAASASKAAASYRRALPRSECRASPRRCLPSSSNDGHPGLAGIHLQLLGGLEVGIALDAQVVGSAPARKFTEVNAAKFGKALSNVEQPERLGVVVRVDLGQQPNRRAPRAIELYYGLEVLALPTACIRASVLD